MCDPNLSSLSTGAPRPAALPEPAVPLGTPGPEAIRGLSCLRLEAGISPRRKEKLPQSGLLPECMAGSCPEAG